MCYHITVSKQLCRSLDGCTIRSMPHTSSKILFIFSDCAYVIESVINRKCVRGHSELFESLVSLEDKLQSTMGKRRMFSASTSVFYPLPYPQIRLLPSSKNNTKNRITIYVLLGLCSLTYTLVFSFQSSIMYWQEQHVKTEKIRIFSLKEVLRKNGNHEKNKAKLLIEIEK